MKSRILSLLMVLAFVFTFGLGTAFSQDSLSAKPKHKKVEKKEHVMKSKTEKSSKTVAHKTVKKSSKKEAKTSAHKSVKKSSKMASKKSEKKVAPKTEKEGTSEQK